MHLLLGLVLIGCAVVLATVFDNVIEPEAGLAMVISANLTTTLVSVIGGAFVAVAFSNRFGLKTRRETIDYGEWKECEYQSKEYRAIERVDFITTSAGKSPVQRIKLLTKDTGKDVAEIAVIKLYDRSYWEFESASKLYVKPRKPVKLNEELVSVHLHDLLQQVSEVLCLGLVSSAERHDVEALSSNRARRLQRWLRESDVMLERAVKMHPVPMGKARTKFVLDSLEERSQRSSVLVGVRIENPFVTLPDVLDEITPRVSSELLRLDDYPNGLRPVD